MPHTYCRIEVAHKQPHKNEMSIILQESCLQNYKLAAACLASEREMPLHPIRESDKLLGLLHLPYTACALCSYFSDMKTVHERRHI